MIQEYNPITAEERYNDDGRRRYISYLGSNLFRRRRSRAEKRPWRLFLCLPAFLSLVALTSRQKTRETPSDYNHRNCERAERAAIFESR